MDNLLISKKSIIKSACCFKNYVKENQIPQYLRKKFKLRLTFWAAARKMVGFPRIDHEKNIPTISNPP